jgi:hypothetical protein
LDTQRLTQSCDRNSLRFGLTTDTTIGTLRNEEQHICTSACTSGLANVAASLPAEVVAAEDCNGQPRALRTTEAQKWPSTFTAPA